MREMQIKPQRDTISHPSKEKKVEIWSISSVDEGVRAAGLLSHAEESVNGHHFEKVWHLLVTGDSPPPSILLLGHSTRRGSQPRPQIRFC